MRRSFCLTLATTAAQGSWLAKIRGPDQQYGLSRDFVRFDASRKVKDGFEFDYYLTQPGHYESCRIQRLPGVTRVRTFFSLSADLSSLTSLTPEELFKSAAFDYSIFGWPAWFDRLFSPHLVSAPLEVKGQIGVGELWFIHRSRVVELFMTVSVPYYFEETDQSIIQVCPIERLKDESLSELLMTAQPLAERLLIGDVHRLPRGDWGGENAET